MGEYARLQEQIERLESEIKVLKETAKKVGFTEEIASRLESKEIELGDRYSELMEINYMDNGKQYEYYGY